jgi:hypothetical protein
MLIFFPLVPYPKGLFIEGSASGNQLRQNVANFMTNLTRQTDLPDARQSQVRKCKVFLEELLDNFVGLGCWASAPGWLVAVERQGTPEVRRQHPESPLPVKVPAADPTATPLSHHIDDNRAGLDISGGSLQGLNVF